ncbi:MAG TPA: hypothetical protein PK252_01620 [Bacteroidales bacterium]|nr:hypothetical protein [Bacteroidales bacterium]
MNNKYHLVRVIYLLFILQLIIVSVNAQKNIEHEIIKVSEANFKKYLEKIPYGHEDYYGFQNRNEFEQVVVGEPYQILYLTNIEMPEDSINYDNLITYSDSWEVPLLVNKEKRCFLHVQKIIKEYKVVGIGYNMVANELNETETRAIFNNKKVNKSILYLPSIKGVYLLRDSLGNKNSRDLKFIPLGSTLKHVHDIKKETYSGVLIEYSMRDFMHVIKVKYNQILNS